MGGRRAPPKLRADRLGRHSGGELRNTHTLATTKLKPQTLRNFSFDRSDPRDHAIWPSNRPSSDSGEL